MKHQSLYLAINNGINSYIQCFVSLVEYFKSLIQFLYNSLQHLREVLISGMKVINWKGLPIKKLLMSFGSISTMERGKFYINTVDDPFKFESLLILKCFSEIL